MKLAIIYYSKTGHTKKMAEQMAKGMESAGGEVRLFSVEREMDIEFLDTCDGIVFGTPVYMATSHWRLVHWLNEKSRGMNFSGKLGGCFATAHYAQGGSDTAILSVLGMLLVKGMLVYSGGAALGKPFIHHGPVALDAVGNHFEECQKDFQIFGKRFAQKAGEISKSV